MTTAEESHLPEQKIHILSQQHIQQQTHLPVAGTRFTSKRRTEIHQQLERLIQITFFQWIIVVVPGCILS